jgi:hypothetical protein
LRFAFTAQHPDDDIKRLADIVRDRVLTSQSQARAEAARGSRG